MWRSLRGGEAKESVAKILRFKPGLCPISTIPLPFFRCSFAVPVSRCCCRCRCVSLYALAPRRRWLAGQLRNNGKNRTRSYFNGRRLRQLFAVYDCNGTEFSYVIFTEQRNFTTAERRSGNGRTATEWWKQGISRSRDGSVVVRRCKTPRVISQSYRRGPTYRLTHGRRWSRRVPPVSADRGDAVGWNTDLWRSRPRRSATDTVPTAQPRSPGRRPCWPDWIRRRGTVWRELMTFRSQATGLYRAYTSQHRH